MKCCDKCDAQQISPVLGGRTCWDDGCDCHKVKPYKGEIHNWSKRYFDQNGGTYLGDTLGYIIVGRPHDHPNFTNWIATSAVVHHNEETDEIETLNSKYLLIS